MHRFRKWSDPRRSPVPESSRSSTASTSSRAYTIDPIPALPPASDFRTSLILPDLSRRFTLLRASTGDPVSFDDLKSKFAEQRARGGENQLSEEEEDMLLETLSRLRAKASTSISTTSGSDSGYGASRESGASSVTSSPRGSAAGKRYSNNLFGSGRFRDYSYVRSVAQQQQQTRNGSGLSTLSTLSSSSSRFKTSEDPIREGDADAAPDANGHQDERGVSPNPDEPLAEPATLLEKKLSKTFRREHLRRASMALEEVIREIEEEVEGVGGADGEGDGDGDDKILIPRSPVVHTQANGTDDKSARSPTAYADEYETGTAFSSDHHVPADNDGSRSTPSPYPRSAGASPTPRIPGYVPGMPRPMTPRDLAFDTDDISPSNSTTPRATSPRLPGSDRASPVVPLHIASSILRRESNASRQPRAASPLSSSIPYTSHSPSGRYTPEDRPRSPDDSYADFGNPLDSSILGRRRPASPFGANTYQPMSVSSRPGTPSNVTWKKPSSPQKAPSRTDGSSASGHSRSGSSVSFTDASYERSGSRSRGQGHSRNGSVASTNDLHDMITLDRSTSSMSRSTRSPALPDSPAIEGTNSGSQSFGVLMSAGQAAADNRPPSAGGDVVSPMSLASRALRSPTPTQYAQRSPTSPTFSEHELSLNTKAAKRASRQTISSPFSLSQSNPLILSPMANSSRSSLESAGSSYHSWNAENKADRTIPLFSALEPQQPAWHDLSDKSNSSASGGDTIDAEEIVQQYAGLSKVDFVAIQDRLVFAAKLKADAPETRERHNSLKRRRPSTSQSNHSINGRESRNADPTPQSSVSRTMPSDSVAKASALLDSVLDSIQSPSARTIDVNVGNSMDEATQKQALSPTDTELSSPTRRRRAALADALFGDTTFGDESALPSNIVNQSAPPRLNGTLLLETYSAHPAHEAASPSPPSPLPSTPHLAPSPSSSSHPHYADQTELAKEVQRRAEVAMAQLKKSPSNTKVNEGGSMIQRKRISPSQISGPRLVSASTSVDTIPLRSPSAASGAMPAGQGSSKLGSRLKRLRGTLRAKPTSPSGEEITPYPLTSPTSAQTVNFDPHPSPPDRPIPVSAADPGGSKLPTTKVTTPPASAGPGLKGFMSRFLKSRPTENGGAEHRKPLQSATLAPPALHAPHHQQTFGQQVRSAPPDNMSFRVPPPQSPEPNSSYANPPPSAPPQGAHTTFDNSQAKVTDENALRQLFDAATNLGLDQSALNDLLARSTSVSSRSTAALMSKHASASTSGWAGALDQSTYDRARSPAASTGRPSMDQASARPSAEIVSKSSVRRPPARNPLPNEANAVLRRTLIFPSEAKPSTPDIMPSRKSSVRRRRASAASALSGSIHDRVPTPPPPRSPTGERFSTESSPPIPQIPVSLLSQTENFTNMPHSAPPLPLEKSSSAYDSLYEMYTGDGKPAITVSGDAHPADASGNLNADTLANLEPGAAVEVLEMANGETIWSIVNGLRDDDAESFYGNRASFVSEYSLKDGSEGVQLFFKEHGRKTSKDSAASYVSRRKNAQGSSKRPETKVFFSSATQIGRLIDNLSQGTDAGSFNISPAANATSFHSESSAHWTVEERLEHMLGSLGTS